MVDLHLRFEIAMYRKANPTGKITLAPVHLEVTALCLWLTMVILSLVQWSAWVRGVTAQTKIASLVLATVPVGCAIQKLRRSFGRVFAGRHCCFGDEYVYVCIYHIYNIYLYIYIIYIYTYIM